MAEGGGDPRVALVVGGASGIGAATAERFRRDGVEVVVADRIDTAEDEFEFVDVTEESSVDALFQRVVEAHGAPDAVVNCAGVSGTFGGVADLSVTAWSSTVAVNLTGAFLVIRAAVRSMAAGGGSIVAVSSGAGLRGFANLADYVASKHGVIGLVRSVALETARHRIRVNAVCPGSVRTPMLEGFVGGDEAALSKMGRMSPIGRLGTPAEIAEAIVWLSGGAAAFVTGSVLSVDGGVSAA